MTQDSAISFSVTIYNDCANDSIQFNNALASPQTVYLYPGMDQIILNPAVSQFNSACTRSCSIVLSDPSLGEVLDAFDQVNGVAAFSSADPSFDGASLTVSI